MEGIEVTEGGSLIATGPGIDIYQMSVFKHRFRMEIRTGLKARVNTLAAYNAKYGTAFRTKKAALADCEARIEKFQEEHDK